MNSCLLVVLSLLCVHISNGHLYFTYESIELTRQRHSVDPEITQNATEIIKSLGFNAEEHYVETEDGYILCIIRMWNRAFVLDSKKVVYLQHGLLDSAHTWISNLRNESLAFILADEGFDVWLGNSRGSTYSRKHRTLNPNRLAFWQFSWDHMARYDLPASIYHVLRHTNSEKISYVGHSQGCQIALAQFDQDPKLQSHIKLFIALAPVAYLGHMTSPIRVVAPFASRLEQWWDLFGHGEFLPSKKLTRFLGTFLCGKGRVPFVCSNVIFLVAGYNVANTNTTRLPVYVAHTPAGTSSQNMVHYCQSVLSDKFQKYDYGARENLKVYGQRVPPEYDLSNITVPTVIYNGGQDWLSVHRDVQRLTERIRPALVNQFYFEKYNHLDFVWGLDAGHVLYPSVVEYLHSYSSKS